MNKELKELEALEQEAAVLNESIHWWEAESSKVMQEVWASDEEEDLQKLKEIESKLEYLEYKGYFEAERMKELDEKLAKYFTKRMKECQSKRKTDGE
jgi:hypothetical protein